MSHPRRKNGRSRREFLKLAGIGVVGAALVGSVAFRILGGRDPISVLDLGISPENDGLTNRENLVLRLGNSSRTVVFPPGDYLVDNSGEEPERGLDPDGVVEVPSFEGEFIMENGARLVFMDNSRPGVVFNGGVGARFVGLCTAFVERPAVRVWAEECVSFYGMEDVVVEGAFVDGSASAGLLFLMCTKPSVLSTEIRNTMADGLHFANCQDSEARDIYTENTGDDGLAFLNYERHRAYEGGYASNITVRNSKGRGISVIGQSGVLIDGFDVNGTSFDGLICAQEDYWRTRVPENVKFVNGEVRNAGTVADPAGKTGSRDGIKFSNVRSVAYEAIRVVAPGERGVAGTAAPFERKSVDDLSISEPGGEVRLDGIEVRDAPGSGFELLGGTYRLEELAVEDSKGAGIVIFDAEYVDGGALTVVNASKEDDLRRAFWFEDNSRMELTGLHVVDDQVAPTGDTVVAYGDGTGDMGMVHDGVVNGRVEVRNPSGLDYTIVDGKR